MSEISAIDSETDWEVNGKKTQELAIDLYPLFIPAFFPHQKRLRSPPLFPQETLPGPSLPLPILPPHRRPEPAPKKKISQEKRFSSKNPLPKAKKTPFPSCTEEEKKIIHEIFDTLANAWPWQLVLKRENLKAQGGKIAHIHPFILLSTVKKPSMRSILTSSIPKIKTGAIQGIRKGINKHIETIEVHLEEFASKMGKSATKIHTFIKAENWEGFASYLFL